MKNKLATRRELMAVARHFNKPHCREAAKLNGKDGLVHHKERMKLVALKARKEAEEHRRHRQSMRASNAKD